MADRKKVATPKKVATNLDPCKDCRKTFALKSSFCKSCVMYKDKLKWQEAK